MIKPKMHTPNNPEINLAYLAELFPNCITEAKGADGRTKFSIDFDLLRQELSDVAIDF